MQPPSRRADLFRRVQGLVHALGTLFFIALFLIFLIQVGARFLFNAPLPWTDELAVVSYIWLIFWSAAFMVKPHEHVAFDLLSDKTSGRLRLFRDRIGLAILAALALWSLPGSYDYITFMAREGTPVLGISMMWVALPFLLLMVSLAVKSLWALVAPCQRRP